MAVVGLFAVCAAVFKAWMVVDAVRRRVPVLWYVILAVPFGDIVYFFAVKLRDFGVRPAEPSGDSAAPARKTALELEREVELSASYQNRVNAGFALLEEREPRRALRHFEAALRTHPREREALYGLGLARLGSEDLDGAVEALSRLVERSFAYEDYNAALALAEAHFRAARPHEAFEVVTAVMADSGSLAHRIALARYQLRAERKADAEATLRAALADFAAQPEDERRKNGATATEARRLLRAFASDDSGL